MTRPDMPAGFESGRRLTACVIGAGGHANRNIYPSLQYAPVDVVALCDLDEEAAASCARRYGVPRYYLDAHEMLEREAAEAVFIVTGYDPEGNVHATALAREALATGYHVWMEKPTAATTAEVRELMDLSRRTDRHVMTGLKKVFSPAVEQAKAIIESDSFGRPSSIFVRYPQDLPPEAERDDLRAMTGFLDHIYHPAAILGYLMGPVACASYDREPFNGGTVTSLRFRSGAIGTMHLAAGSSGSGPLERVEVIGEGANLVIENAVELTYYRPAERPAYGRSPSYLVDEDCAPLRWAPEFSLGQLYNKNLFYQGYVPEIVHFCRALIDGVPPSKGTLADSLEIMRLFEFYRRVPPATWVELGASKDRISTDKEAHSPWTRSVPSA